MIGSRIGWLLLEFLTIAFFLYSGSAYALAFGIVLFLIPIVSSLINLYVRRNLTIHMDAPISLHKGCEGKLDVVLNNTTIFPVLHVRLRVAISNQLNGQTARYKILTWSAPKTQKKISLAMRDDYCGSIAISSGNPVLFDCFGLLGIKSQCSAIPHTTVQPDMFRPEITMLPSFRSFEDNDIYSQEKPGADLSETFQIREYVPGDSPRQIHWKLTGKFDQIIVRDPALPIEHSVLVFWERTGASNDLDCVDAQAETVISVCKSLLDQSVQFTLGWNDIDREICVLHEIHDMDELVGVIPRILQAAGKLDGISGAELLLNTASHALCAHMIYIAEELQSGAQELRRFGNTAMLLHSKNPVEGATIFDSIHYREQLSQIQI